MFLTCIESRKNSYFYNILSLWVPLLEKYYNSGVSKIGKRSQSPTTDNRREIKKKISLKFKHNGWNPSFGFGDIFFFVLCFLKPRLSLSLRVQLWFPPQQQVQDSKVKSTRVSLLFYSFHSVSGDKHLKTTSFFWNDISEVYSPNTSGSFLYFTSVSGSKSFTLWIDPNISVEILGSHNILFLPPGSPWLIISFWIHRKSCWQKDRPVS